jgi:hypothetical protein
VNPAPAPRSSACSSCSRRGEHSDWCPRLGLDWDPNPRLSDEQVRAMGYSHRDSSGRWIHEREVADLDDHARQRRERAQARGAAACLTCGVLDDRHFEWCWRGDELENTVGAAARDCHDLEAAIAWQPPDLGPPKLLAPEREALNKLFAARVRAREQEREQARGQTAPKLWTLKEYRDARARGRKDTP